MKIKHVIAQRLALQSTERKLEQLKIPADIKFIKSMNFLNSFVTWDKRKQDEFVELVGGKVNKKRTLNFLLN
ncbi:MAG: hypothetical protein AABY22_09990 [Nanoarchaeota archaeon]